MIKAILFDLDGTLLPMDSVAFNKEYAKEMIKLMDRYDASFVAQNIYKCVEAMVNNNGESTNEVVFWNTLVSLYGKQILDDKVNLDNFYHHQFNNLKSTCSCNKLSNKMIKTLKEKGYIVVLATNPLFPSIATEKRIEWAGLDKNDFFLYTTYENSCYSKPNLNYYKEILQKINCDVSECLMIGNDVEDDMVVSRLGMDVFLLTDCLINLNNVDINLFRHGSMIELSNFINDLPDNK